MPFYVDERAIVPRSFIAELLADGSIDPWLGEHTRRVLDLCTGNGSLAVLAAMTYPDVSGRRGRPVDRGARSGRHQRHAPRARRAHHAARNPTAWRSVRGPYDLILCNPPYVNAQSMARAARRIPRRARTGAGRRRRRHGLHPPAAAPTHRPA